MGDIVIFDKNHKKRKSTDTNNVVSEETDMVKAFNQLFGKFFTGENDDNNKEE